MRRTKMKKKLYCFFCLLIVCTASSMERKINKKSIEKTGVMCTLLKAIGNSFVLSGQIFNPNPYNAKVVCDALDKRPPS